MSDSLFKIDVNVPIPPPPPVTKKQTRSDGWGNVASSLGTAKDKRRSMAYSASNFLDIQSLNIQYAGDGLIQRIINALPEDMMRQWGTVQNDPKAVYDEGLIQKELMRLKAPQAFREAKQWARLQGGALIYIATMGTGSPASELNLLSMNKNKVITGLKVFDLGDIMTSECKWDLNINSPTYGQIIIYKVRSRSGNEEKMVDIHASRCIPVFGERVPTSTNTAKNLLEARYWGISMLQFLYDDIRDFRGVMGSVANILQEFIIGKYKFDDLDDMLSAGGEDKVKNRLASIELTKSSINAVMLGTDEDYIRDSANVTGIPDLIDRFMMMLAAVTGYPVTKLFGRSASGLNATGEGDNKNYYDKVRSEQNDMTPYVQRLVDVIIKFLGLPDGDYSWSWNPLQQLSAEEQNNAIRIEAEAYRTTAAGDQLMISEGVLTPEEVRIMRFGKNPVINPAEVPKPLPEKK